MDPWLSSIILGIVEGVTEFLPVSSTGHLILTGALLGHAGEKAASYDIIIQLGAILAVVVMYRERFAGLVVPRPRERFTGTRGLMLLFLTCLPAGLLGLFARKAIKAHLFAPLPVALALAAGAVMILIVESRRGGRDKYHDFDDVSPALALGIGLFQCLSLWPGFSRSASTILGAMILGSRRKLAAEYSFVAAVPIMLAATGYEFYKSWAEFSMADLQFLAVGFVTAFFSAWLAVKWFIGLVSRMTLRPFAVYRLLLALAVFVFWPS
ncbi:Undecaprenyl-diphosphatase [Fundidesulfovibrio magnetotacticus]|uniref:Undecaprenyl-diphosphatase n=1 Tax=Fundidesulfovibrio magnetotacticus TaxID=2730080 RepID=A0A6V8LTQ2_9BACT|nr:undecaprenyl-diphosphate phosphatase [Fundidesulfovibrio magnetotacticus]GFK95843.1 Undecaprenyl-diphosphatase [Fundidesulfovibrio magnetotacticus]